MSSPSLADLGWNDWLASHLPPGLLPARVASEQRGRLTVLGLDASPRGARVAGRLQHGAASRLDLPAVGDWVAVRVPHGDGDVLVEHVLPRMTRLVRQAAGRRTEPQLVAANVDVVGVVTSLDADFNPRRLERYLAFVSESGALPLVVLSKSDACDDASPFVDAVRAAAPGVPSQVASARTGQGVPELRARVFPGQSLALVGSSGVGKSSLVNALLGHDVQATGSVRESDGRGRHVTTARELFVLDGGGLLVDTPGMRELQLWGGDEDGAAAAFGDVVELAAGCRFADCAHGGEPGCAVAAAVAAGTLDAERVTAWRKLERELERQAAKQDLRLRIEHARQLRRFGRLVRTHAEDVKAGRKHR